MRIVKNISFPTPEEIANVLETEQDEIAIAQYSVFAQQVRKGTRLFVEKKISDELINTEIKNIKFHEIPFPFESVEIYFEDEKIHTILAQKNSESLFYIMWDNGDNLILSFYGEEQFNQIINDHPDNFISDVQCYEESLSAEKAEEFGRKHLEYIKLLINVFLYISIPQYKAIPFSEKQLKRQFKAGVKNRPKRPLYKVIYVPSVINTNKKQAQSEDAQIKAPHFRRGHFMMLRDERYKEQGKLVFRRSCMIHGGNLENKLYAAVKR